MQQQNYTKTEIEKTNKRWKKLKLVALGVAILGFIIANKMPEEAQGWTIFGALLISFCIYIAAKIGAWWTNG